MKKIIYVAVVTVTFAAHLFAQTKTTASNSKGNLIKETLINLEKRMWQAFKDKDDKHLYILTTEDAINISELGMANKTATLKNVTLPKCEIKSYKMEDINLTLFNANTALLTYKGERENVCGGNAGSASVWTSSLYLKQNGNWLNAFHQETPAIQSK